MLSTGVASMGSAAEGAPAEVSVAICKCVGLDDCSECALRALGHWARAHFPENLSMSTSAPPVSPIERLSERHMRKRAVKVSNWTSTALQVIRVNKYTFYMNEQI